MQVDIPKLPGWAWAVAGGCALLGVHHGFNLAKEAGARAVDLAYDGGEALATGAGWLKDGAESVTDRALREWRQAGHHTRGALPFIVAGAALILWRRG